MTVSPFLGPGSLQPAVDTARRFGGGLFVLARTSNPDAGTLQHAVVGDRTVAQAVVDTVGAWNAEDGSGSFGVVVGATLAEMDVDLDRLGGPVLAPGLGAQGGSVADLRRLFGAGQVVLPSVSRDVLAAGPDPASLRAAADSWATELAG
jgi:orotidine-5'-phosphate decarboxylase